MWQDVHGTELHVHSSCVYYLTREGPPDGASPSYKADMLAMFYDVAQYLEKAANYKDP